MTDEETIKSFVKSIDVETFKFYKDYSKMLYFSQSVSLMRGDGICIASYHFIGDNTIMEGNYVYKSDTDTKLDLLYEN